jgi:hypothetical protein
VLSAGVWTCRPQLISSPAESLLEVLQFAVRIVSFVDFPAAEICSHLVLDFLRPDLLTLRLGSRWPAIGAAATERFFSSSFELGAWFSLLQI